MSICRTNTSRSSCVKMLERQIIRVWKCVTRSVRKQHRASFLPSDFVLITSRRRSMFLS
ncbi:hypothetical protein JAAARDRAFT_123854 [Jaapia argillacea MUCL 33604]|uniref:Uncharacterized protein n=1 Tax=Jaapia argillacea MUCL 33604 TaxID=933084 RepID=A0A067Q3A8_9AGAM|nr:hypothetical protein JAAARDRAFT_123854 [Jaapia argillacea MUCL 33604]